jgi:hypothetical protein
VELIFFSIQTSADELLIIEAALDWNNMYKNTKSKRSVFANTEILNEKIELLFF